MRARVQMCLVVALGLTGLFASQCIAQEAESKSTAPTEVRVGLKSIVLPAPSSELLEPGPDYRVILEPLAPISNRLVAGYILPDELHAIETGKSALTRYALVEVPRRAEFADVDDAIFHQVADMAAKQFNVTLTNSLNDMQSEINMKLKSLDKDGTQITLDKPTPLGLFFNKPDAVALGMVLKSNHGGESKTEAGVTLFMHLKNRILIAYLFTPYDGETSVNWLRTTGEHWADAILKANR